MTSSVGELAAALVAIDSVNPALVPGGAGEREIASFVADWCLTEGFEVETLGDERPSVVAVRRGSGGGRSLLLNGHLDTVGVAGMEAPFEARIEGDRLYGRGAYDMKGALAAILLAASDATGLRGDVIVTLVADEELASIGTEAVVEHVGADAAIVVEPTDLRVAIAHRGFVGFELETEGVAAHGSRPDLGVDAIAKMGHVLVGLDALDRSLRERPTHHLLGSGSLHAGVVAGGSAFSTYPERCVLQAERRTVPGESLDHVEAELQGLLDRLQSGDPDFEGAWRTVAARQGFEVGLNEEIVRLVRQSAGAGKPVGQTYWADSALLAEALIPSVLFGPGGDGAHAQVEWVSVADVERCAAVYLSVATEFCAS